MQPKLNYINLNYLDTDKRLMFVNYMWSRTIIVMH